MHMAQFENNTSGNNPYSSPEEMAKATGLTLKEAESVWTSWNYRQPEDPETRLSYAQEGSRYEHEMRGLNTDRTNGDISEAEYQHLAQELATQHQQRIREIVQKKK